MIVIQPIFDRVSKHFLFRQGLRLLWLKSHRSRNRRDVGAPEEHPTALQFLRLLFFGVYSRSAFLNANLFLNHLSEG